jgi:hypothetical protein
VTTKAENQLYYQRHTEQEKQRTLAYYHANKDKIDREAKKIYMREYLKTHSRKKPTRAQKDERNRLRRERYKTDPVMRAKDRAEAKRWQMQNPEKRKAQRLKTYSLTVLEFQAMLTAQDGHCAICPCSDMSKPKAFPIVDHDHKTKKNRGLLCAHCNRGLGHFKDNPELLQKAIEYLIKWSSGATLTKSSGSSKKRSTKMESPSLPFTEISILKSETAA